MPVCKTMYIQPMTSNQLVECEPAQKGISLREAFEVHKYDFISKSRKRQKEIQMRAFRRKSETELKSKKYLEIANDKNFYQKNRAASHYDPSKENNNKIVYTIDKTLFAKHRPMSSEEIKTQTLKKYKKLPEVQQKQLKQKLEDCKKLNRIKSNIFKKVMFFK